MLSYDPSGAHPIAVSLEASQKSQDEDQRKTKGQQLKGKIVSALFRTFWHLSTHSHTFSELFPQDFFLEIRGFTFTTVLAQRDEKRPKGNKKEDKTILHVSCCTFVLLREEQQVLGSCPRHCATGEGVKLRPLSTLRQGI